MNAVGIVLCIVAFMMIVYFCVLIKIGHKSTYKGGKLKGGHGSDIGRALDSFFNNPFFNFILPLVIIGALIYGLYLAAKNHLI